MTKWGSYAVMISGRVEIKGKWGGYAIMIKWKSEDQGRTRSREHGNMWEQYELSKYKVKEENLCLCSLAVGSLRPHFLELLVHPCKYPFINKIKLNLLIFFNFLMCLSESCWVPNNFILQYVLLYISFVEIKNLARQCLVILTALVALKLACLHVHQKQKVEVSCLLCMNCFLFRKFGKFYFMWYIHYRQHYGWALGCL